MLLEIQQRVVDQGVERPVLAGKITVKGLAGDIHLLAQVADGDLLVALGLHGGQQPLLQAPLALGRLLGLAKFVHILPPCFPHFIPIPRKNQEICISPLYFSIGQAIIAKDL